MVDFNGQLQWSASMVDCFGFKVIKDVLGKAIERSNFQLQLKMRTISWKISWLATVRLTTWRLEFEVENLPESDHRKFVIIFIFIFSLSSHYNDIIISSYLFLEMFDDRSSAGSKRIHNIITNVLIQDPPLRPPYRLPNCPPHSNHAGAQSRHLAVWIESRRASSDREVWLWSWSSLSGRGLA